jgi:hypothetical protein
MIWHGRSVMDERFHRFRQYREFVHLCGCRHSAQPTTQPTVVLTPTDLIPLLEKMEVLAAIEGCTDTRLKARCMKALQAVSRCIDLYGQVMPSTEEQRAWASADVDRSMSSHR